MMSTNNIFSPANGSPIMSPTQDVVLGVFYLTTDHVSGPADEKTRPSFGSALRGDDRVRPQANRHSRPH